MQHIDRRAIPVDELPAAVHVIEKRACPRFEAPGQRHGCLCTAPLARLVAVAEPLLGDDAPGPPRDDVMQTAVEGLVPEETVVDESAETPEVSEEPEDTPDVQDEATANETE